MPTTLKGLVIACLAAQVPFAASHAQQAERPEEGPAPDGFLFHTPHVTLGVRGGLDLRRAGSDIFDFVTDELTLGRGDFSAFTFGGELGIRVAPRTDLVLGAAYSKSTAQSEFRDFVDQDNLPIAQRTTLATTQLTAAARWYLTPRDRQIGRFAWMPARFTPYMGAGLGMMQYSFEQSGSFVDFQDLSIFDDTFQSGDWTAMAMVMAGAHYSLGTRVFLSGDLRFTLADGDLTGDFKQWTDDIDLSGLQFSAGLHVRM